MSRSHNSIKLGGCMRCKRYVPSLDGTTPGHHVLVLQFGSFLVRVCEPCARNVVSEIHHYFGRDDE